MRFLLVNPNYPISEGPSPPLGLAFLGAALEKAGVEVKILDFVVFPYTKDILEKRLKNFKPDFLGVTAVSMTFDTATEIIKDTKAITPDILTIMGGPHISFAAEQTLLQLPELDFAVKGEGEETVVELVHAWKNKSDLAAVKGIAYRKGSEVHTTGKRDLIQDVDSLPMPARHLLPMGRYKAINMPISMTTSRGCPFKCIFCVGRKMVGAKVRYRSPDLVVDELEYLSTLGFPQINVADDLFTANKAHCMEICRGIQERNLKIKWSSFARVDTVSLPVLKAMRAAGCYSVSFGVETANSEIMKTIKKGITISQVIDAVNMCLEADIIPSASFILGLPGETPDTLKETVDFGKKLQEMGVTYGFHLLAPFPGTEVSASADRYGIKILTRDWKQYHANRAIVETKDVNKKMLDDIVIEWENKINQWLGDIGSRIKSGEASEEDAFPLVNLERTILLYDLMMNQTIEKKGWWPNAKKTESTDRSSSMDTLVSRLHEETGQPIEALSSTLTHAAQKGVLREIKDKGKCGWEWVDYLEV